MGAMLVGMATGVAAMGISFVLIGFSVVTRTVIALIIRTKAQRLNMDSGLWAISGFFLGLWIIPVCIIVKRKMKSLKCTACGQRVEHGANFCISCGTPVKAFDDGAFLKKVLLIAAVAFIVFYIVSGVYYTFIT